MKTVLMTGLTGTLGPKVAKQFEMRGWKILEWNHHQVSPEDSQQSETFWQLHSIDAVCHMAMGSAEWAAWLAERCKWQSIPYLFVSTAMVFDASRNGPYGIFDERNTQEGYGQYKVECEDAIWRANPDAMIARIGWQIFDDATGNNMLANLEQQHLENGIISASVDWYPATSHMSNTAIGFLQLIERNEAGLYHLDSNAKDRWSFYELACALKTHYNKPWQIIPNNDYQHDQRLVDDRIALPPLSDRFAKPNLIQRAGIIGTNWGRTHIPHYRANGIEVTALSAKDKHQLEQTCIEADIPNACSNIDELNSLDIVTIATPAATHAEMIASLSTPRLICEKPLLGLDADLSAWQKPNHQLLVNYAFSQLETAKTIQQWLASQTKPCNVTLDSAVNLPEAFNIKEWFLETASHPASWLLHCFGEFTDVVVKESKTNLVISAKCQEHHLTFKLALNGKAGIEHNLTIKSDQTLTSKGYYRVGEKWRFEPILVEGEAINEGEYTESDCWMDANRRSIGLMIAMFNGSVDWHKGLELGAFDSRKALLLEKLFQ